MGMYFSPLPDFCLALIMLPLLSSPAKHTRNSAGKFSAIEKPPVKQLCEDMDDEMRRCFIGPMPVKEFFHKFLPTRKLSKAQTAALPGFEEVATTNKENDRYDKFVRNFLHSVYLPFLIVVLSLGPHYRFILHRDQSIQLIKGSGHGI